MTRLLLAAVLIVGCGLCGCEHAGSNLYPVEGAKGYTVQSQFWWRCGYEDAWEQRVMFYPDGLGIRLVNAYERGYRDGASRRAELTQEQGE